MELPLPQQICVFVLFATGLTWAPAQPGRMSYCNAADDPDTSRLHCKTCDALTELTDTMHDNIRLPDNPNAFLPIMRATSAARRPACRHWIPIPAVTIPRKNRHV